MRETLSAYRILVEKTKGRRVLGIPRRRWENYIKMELKNKMRLRQGSPGLAKIRLM
jgi:hypothetical protein